MAQLTLVVALYIYTRFSCFVFPKTIEPDSSSATLSDHRTWGRTEPRPGCGPWIWRDAGCRRQRACG